MSFDVGSDLGLVLRLVVAAVLGAAIGLEREIHEHPAGMRTHLLVSLGSAGFTVLSIYAFPGPVSDPSRVAAQIVTGVGFLGAGAILKEGANVRGLTTAASLWAVAAVGMAAGAGSLVVGIAITVIVVVSLWPLRILSDRFVGRDRHVVGLQLAIRDPHRLAAVVEATDQHGVTVGRLATRRDRDGGLLVDLELRADDVAHGVAATSALAALDGVDLVESSALGE